MSSCPSQACGARFLVTDRARHNREDCANRKVPCKNWECGCHQMIRIRMRKLHEKVRKISIIPSRVLPPERAQAQPPPVSLPRKTHNLYYPIIRACPCHSHIMQ